MLLAWTKGSVIPVGQLTEETKRLFLSPLLCQSTSDWGTEVTSDILLTAVGSRIMVPRRHLLPNPENLRICSPRWQKGLCRCDSVWNGEIILSDHMSSTKWKRRWFIVRKTRQGLASFEDGGRGPEPRNASGS